MASMAETKLLKRKRKAELDGNTTRLTSVCIELAELYTREGHYNDAIKEYKIIAEIHNVQQQPLDYARANRMIGEAYNHLREYNKALKHQEIHLSVAKQQGDRLEEQRALATIGHTYLTSHIDAGDPDALVLASKSFMRSLNICEDLTGISKREHMDMMARLFANLGSVQEYQGNHEKGIELAKRSITICKSYDIYEQLEHGYRLLGSLYTRMKDHGNAIHHYNLAIEVAGRLEDKNSLICASLSSKADILIKLADFQRAKSILHKAYKLKAPNQVDRENIESNLKVVTAMCYTEDSLLLASDTDYALRKKLYEKMGDGACLLRNYTKGIEYYKKMLESAEKNGEHDLSACYVSLAQTYKDNKEYDLSIEYFKKDYETQTNLKEGITTLFSLIDAMELAGKPFEDIAITLNQARIDCKKAGDVYLEAKTLNRFIGFYRKFNKISEAEKLEEQLENLNVDCTSDSDVETITENIGDNINLSQITDESDCDSETEPNKPRKRHKGFVIKRNNKGETQLHTACINGNFQLVQRLLEQGHAVNIRDNCGWLPIHEACICGHVEIVKLLIEKGAWINDRGGNLCNGMTPLHDAASNGHLEVLEYMLDKGASAVAKTDDGETPLHILKTWRANNDLDEIALTFYENLVERMMVALDKTGQTKQNICVNDNKALIVEHDSSHLTPSSEEVKCEIGSLRRKIDVDNDYEIADDYKKTINNLKKRPLELYKKRPEVKRPALLQADDVGDDWLEDDLNVKNKKRRTDEFNQSADKVIKQSKKKRQSTLIKAGFTRRSSSPLEITEISENLSPNLQKCVQSKITSFTQAEDDSTTITATNAKVVQPTSLINKMLSVDVRIEGKLFRIPVPMTEVESLTMKWLADEATKRYYKKEAMRPILELETVNGAVLSEDDYISILFPVCGLQSEEVRAKVIKWNIPPITERYKDACLALNMEIKGKIIEIIESSTITLSVPDENLREHLLPLCKALNRQSNLHELNLSGNFCTDKCVELLCDSLSTLDNLAVLNLSVNNLTSAALGHLSSAVSDAPVLPRLADLNLSYNPLGDESFKHLSAVTRHLKLRSLGLCSVDFTRNLSRHVTCYKDLRLHFEFLECLDISHNSLSREGLLKFVNSMQPLNLSRLNVGGNRVREDGLGAEIVRFLRRNEFGFPNLRSINLSACRINDEEVYQLLSVIASTNCEELDLSCNNITSTSLKRLLEMTSISKLNLSRCDLSGIDDSPWNLNGSGPRALLTTLDYVENHRQCDKLITMWREGFRKSTVVEGLESGLRLSS